MSDWAPRFVPNAPPRFTVDMRQLEQLLNAAKTSYKAGQFSLAEQYCQRLLEIEPNYLGGKALLGMIAGQTGRPGLAIEILRDVVAKDANAWAPANALAILLREAGLLQEALDIRLAANRLKPEDHNGQDELGLCYLALHEPRKAVKCFQAASTIAPDVALYHTHIGDALVQAKMPSNAEGAFRYSLSLNPDQYQAHAALGELMVSMGNRREAVEAFRKAAECSDDPIEKALYEARSFTEDGRLEEAVALYRETTAIHPDSARIQAAAGSFLTRMGRFDEAIEHLRRALELQPYAVDAYGFYVDHKKITSEDRPIIDGMLKLLANPGIGEVNRQELHLSLGKAHNDLKDFEVAMWHYDEGSRIGERLLRLQFGPFERDRYVKFFDDLINTFDDKFIANGCRAKSDSELAVFIVGMMRSGTTLTEQILSSHPQVSGAGELQFWLEQLRKVTEAPSWPRIEEITEPWASNYVSMLAETSPESVRVTDKNPANHLAVGLIRACMPNARIIHCLRDPVDTCISAYVTRNSSPSPYSFDRSNIAFYYQQYARLIKHWRNVFGDDRYMEQRYEAVVADKSAAVQRLTAFCGLEANEAVERHEQNQRVVATPSNWQVRQPIYSTSVGRSRNYEPWLADFEELRELDL